MASIDRLLLVGLLSIGLGAATTAQAGSQLFEASWSVKSFGNECDGKGNPPYCTVTTGDYAIYQAWAMPAGFLCNPGQPRCPFASTPVDCSFGATSCPPAWTAPVFNALGGLQFNQRYCTPYTYFTSGYKGGASGRPAKGGTVFHPPAERLQTDSAALPKSVFLHQWWPAQDHCLHGDQHRLHDPKPDPVRS